MAMNLKTAHDHPAKILRRAFISDSIPANIFAGILEEYEATNEVTFAALDSETLDRVQRLRTRLAVTPQSSTGAQNIRESLIAATVDLLGLDD